MAEEKRYTVEGPPAQKKHVPPLAGQDFSTLGHVALDFHARPRAGMTLKEVLAPSYWMAVANNLRPDSEVRVIPEDHSWYAKLLVLSCDHISAHMAVIYYSDLKEKTVLSDEMFDIRPTQNNTKFGVFRKADGQVVKQGFVTDTAAKEYLGDYIRAMAA